MNGKVSVITICYNSEKFIEQTINSIISQNYPNIEYIIVDGNSKDNTVNIIKKYEHNISKWISEPDKGIYDAMNKGIKLATGDWIIFMNSGDNFINESVLSDIFLKEKFENINVVYGNIINDWGTHKEKKDAFPLKYFSYRMPFCHQAVFVRRNTLLHNLFDLSFKYAADFNQFYNLYYKYGASIFKYVPIYIAECDTSDSFSRKNMLPMWLEYMKIRSSHKDLRWYWDNFKNFIKIKILRHKI